LISFDGSDDSLGGVYNDELFKEITVDFGMFEMMKK
jgi:hypothetical protein